MMINILYFALAVYCGVFLALALMQRTFMYHPEIGEEKDFLALAPQHNVEPWRNARGVLIGWKRANTKPAKYRMLILHGNGGHALTRTYFMDGFAAPDNNLWEFYALEYPGYGWRKGNANETEIVNAANDALEEMLKHDARPLYITGESLGTGVACLLAARHPQEVNGLFLVTPYTSTVDVAVGRFPIFPTRLVMQDKYEAAAALKEYSGPVAVLLAGQDFIVPTRFGQKLFDDYGGPKKLWVQSQAGHNSLDFDPHAAWWKEVADFWVRGQ
jgi:pimeloyl-ACP methyl ester carboxylesterase